MKLRAACHEYDRDKWRAVASKINVGAAPEACSNRMECLEAVDDERLEEQKEALSSSR